LNFERTVLSLVWTDIAGAVPTWASLQDIESEERAFKNAEECPYLVDGCCPNAGTRPSGARSTFREWWGSCSGDIRRWVQTHKSCYPLV